MCPQFLEIDVPLLLGNNLIIKNDADFVAVAHMNWPLQEHVTVIFRVLITEISLLDS